MVRIEARRFRRLAATCPRRIFAERLPESTAGPWARRALGDIQRHLGLALGGEAGARLAQRLAMPASGDMLLRLVRQTVPRASADTVKFGLAGSLGRRYGAGMTTRPDPLHAGDRFPAEVIGYAVRLSFRFPLSLRMGEEMLALRGSTVSHETVRQCGLTFGRVIATRIRQQRLARGDEWHLDEVMISSAGKRHHLWRAVGWDGFVRARLVQRRRATTAAKRLLCKLLKKPGRAPRVLITDTLQSHAAAQQDLQLRGEHRRHQGLNNRAESSHRPTRRRERPRKRFTSPQQVQCFLSIHDPIDNLIHLRRDHRPASEHRTARARAFAAWAEVAA
ncbi:transposase-like protein [Azospirillum soli]|nr:transposase-like protein [Azospirillum soli]